ncbi:MAG: RrF2 family transcriptional regulator [Candidatus Omnitrophota bacterium]
MRISARCDYACKAVLELALHWPNSMPLQIQEISDKQDIPLKYLPQILLQLKRLDIVESIRGKQGGYLLAKPPYEIQLGPLMREVGGPLLPVVNSATDKVSVFVTIWKEVEDSMAKVLDKITFEDILKKEKGIEGAIVYQI